MTTANESARLGTRPTERELQALRAWAEGGNTRIVASRLGISVNTVDKLLANVRARAGVGTTQEAADRFCTRVVAISGGM